MKKWAVALVLLLFLSEFVIVLPKVCASSPTGLSNGYVTPTSGTTSTTISYYVTYYDPAGKLALSPTVFIDNIAHGMGISSGSGSNGVYKYSTTLSAGSHAYYFRFTSGSSGQTIWWGYPSQYSGPTVGSTPTPTAKPTPTPAPSTVTSITISPNPSSVTQTSLLSGSTLTVMVKNQNGIGMSGVAVYFTGSSGSSGYSGSFAFSPSSPVTTSSGGQTTTTLTLGSLITKSYTITVTASANGKAGSTTVTFTPPTSVATPNFSPPGGTYSTAQSITILSSTTGATIRYSTNGAQPTSSSPAYSGPISVSSTTTIMAKAFKSGMTDSSTASATYTINIPKVAIPTISPVTGTYSSSVTVSISCATSGATVRYTTNGVTPTSSSTVYTGSFLVSSTSTVMAKAFKTGMTDSDSASATYTINIPKVAFIVGSISGPAKVAYGNSVVISVTITNTGSTAHSSTLNLNMPQGFSFSKKSISIGDLLGGSSKTYLFSGIAPSFGTTATFSATLTYSNSFAGGGTSYVTSLFPCSVSVSQGYLITFQAYCLTGKVTSATVTISDLSGNTVAVGFDQVPEDNSEIVSVPIYLQPGIYNVKAGGEVYFVTPYGDTNFPAGATTQQISVTKNTSIQLPFFMLP